MIRVIGGAINATLLLVVLWIVSMFLGGCATTPDNELPCDPQTCTPEHAWEQTRDPFGPEPISFGSIFGPQPVPGRVTVEPAAPK